jgi:hypothetical protein
MFSFSNLKIVFHELDNENNLNTLTLAVLLNLLLNKKNNTYEEIFQFNIYFKIIFLNKI